MCLNKQSASHWSFKSHFCAQPGFSFVLWRCPLSRSAFHLCFSSLLFIFAHHHITLKLFSLFQAPVHLRSLNHACSLVFASRSADPSMVQLNTFEFFFFFLITSSKSFATASTRLLNFSTCFQSSLFLTLSLSLNFCFLAAFPPLPLHLPLIDTAGD